MSLCHPNKSEIKSETEEMVMVFVIEETESVLKIDFCVEDEKNVNNDEAKNEQTESHEESVKKYRCPECPKVFSKNFMLISHLLKHTNKKCKVCGKIYVAERLHSCKAGFHSPKALENRTIMQRGKGPYICEMCKTPFPMPHALRKHMLMHTGEKPHVCEICKAAFRLPHTLNKHMLIHTGERPHVCEICKTAFRLSQTLKKHMLMHTGETPHVCEICKAAFRLPQTLKKHLLMHTGERPHVCEICKKAFCWSQALKNHLKRHAVETGPKFKCHDCLRIFSNENGLTLHSLLRTCEGNKRHHVCEICKTRFCQPENLTKHMLQHTGEVPSKFACTDCPKVFRTANNLKCHSTMHTGEKPHKCEICGSTFRLPISLTRHMVTHTNARPHICKICNRAFRLRSTLKKHMLREMGEIHFKLKCPRCPKVFITSEGLKLHSKMHTNDERAFDESLATPILESGTFVLKEEIKVEEIEIDGSVKEEFDPVDEEDRIFINEFSHK